MAAVAQGTGYIELLILTKPDKETGRWVSGSKELGVYSQGDNPKEALDRAGEAILIFLNEAAAMGTIWGVLEEAGIEIHGREAEPESMFSRLRHAAEGYFYPMTFPIPPQGGSAPATR